MISQVVESDFVLGSERFYCCVFQARPNNASSSPLYWHWREQCWNTLEAQTTASLSHSSFSLRVAPNLVVMFLLIWRMFSKDSSSSTPPTWGGQSDLCIKNVLKQDMGIFGTQSYDLAVVLMSKVWFCITGHVASSSSVVVILAENHS